jgi:hypothetical protein
MNARVFTYLMFVLAGVGAMIGTGVLASDRSLLSLCQKACWLNSLLYAFCGEQGGKLALAMIWYALASLACIFAWKIKKTSHKKP